MISHFDEVRVEFEDIGFHQIKLLFCLPKPSESRQIDGIEYAPTGVDDRLVLFGNLGSTRLIAAEGTLVNLNLRHFWEPNGKWLKRYNAYINYSHLFKDESEFKDSRIVNPGMLLDMGPFWIWVDLIVGKNAWYLNDSPEMSGLGAGGTDDWETRFNVNFEWYF